MANNLLNQQPAQPSNRCHGKLPLLWQGCLDYWDFLSFAAICYLLLSLAPQLAAQRSRRSVEVLEARADQGAKTLATGAFQHLFCVPFPEESNIQLSQFESSPPTDAQQLSAPSGAASLPPSWQDYPIIPDLNQIRGIFKQFRIEVQENKKRWARRKSLLPVSLYVYQVREGDSIFTIGAKTSISVESIATLNRIEHPNGLPQAKSYILIPNDSGIFLPQDLGQDNKEEKPYQSLSAWEHQLRKKREELLFHRLTVGQRIYFYYPKSQFDQNERSSFLDNLFHLPVQNDLYITSAFGRRSDPISGKSSFHDGLDLRSPYAAPVYSIANATVVELGENALYGLYVKIRLENSKKQEALYGHLIAVLVHKGQRISAGEAIGNSGKSGRSTGPHLHLTIFENGKAIDPSPLFRASKQATD